MAERGTGEGTGDMTDGRCIRVIFRNGNSIEAFNFEDAFVADRHGFLVVSYGADEDPAEHWFQKGSVLRVHQTKEPVK